MTNEIDAHGVPLPPRPWLYSNRMIEAMAAAAQIHGTQVRKGTTIPYLSHLLGLHDQLRTARPRRPGCSWQAHILDI